MNFDITFHRYVSPAEAERILGVSEQTLAHWRVKGYGPKFSELTKRCIRYWLPYLLEWAEARRKGSTAEELDADE